MAIKVELLDIDINRDRFIYVNTKEAEEILSIISNQDMSWEAYEKLVAATIELDRKVEFDEV